MYRSTLFICIALLSCLPAAAFAWEEDPNICALFKNAQIEGTFVLYDVSDHRLGGCNQTRAETRYNPASTFKIAHSLIGLSTDAVKSVDEVLPYKGPTEPFIPEWAHDMGLRKAIKISNVPIYQELARRIGLERMREGLATLQYGNQRTGDVVDRFWLDGPLKISALEQTRFLSGLVQGMLPLPKHVQESVREILLLEEGSDWKLYGKTGWQNAPGNGIGWLVGWVEKKEGMYVFALNIDINKPSDAAERIKLAKESLKLLGLL
ncbi:class D beta-lactamase [Sulfurovum sp.]|uniref:class D beta-lactamase n=1 Tax=Sulfurovum sp. TaxID=1969726 RepID=UPI0039C986A2